MSKWDKIIENALTDIATDTPSANGFRENIAHKLFEAEQKATQAEPSFLGETPEQRVNDMRNAMSFAVAIRLKNDLGTQNKVWQQAKQLLDIPMSRAHQDRWPWESKLKFWPTTAPADH